MEQLSPLDLFKEEIDNDEIYVRVNAIHRLKTIAVLIGTEGIKSNLLPLIDSNFLKKLYNKIKIQKRINILLRGFYSFFIYSSI
jgi:hypothetical protein